MDQSSLSPADTARALQDLQRVNRWSLGIGPSVRTLRPLIGRTPQRQWLLDLGTGSGQVPKAVARSARRGGVYEIIHPGRALRTTHGWTHDACVIPCQL